MVATTGDQVIHIRIGGVLIRGRERIYLLTNYGQASGIEGGRFGEIGKYVAPWMHTEDPRADRRLSKSVRPVNTGISRVDLWSNDRGQRVWSGSYFTRNCPGCEGYFVANQTVFTATWAIKDPRELRLSGDAELARFLNQASGVVKSIRYRNPSAKNNSARER